MNNRINASFTWYKSNTLNQFFPVIPPAPGLVTIGYVNAGNIQNTGFEVLVGFEAIKSNNLNWQTSVNASANKNKILEVWNEAPSANFNFRLTDEANGYRSQLQKGGSYGDIYAPTFMRDDQGRIQLSGNGTVGNPYIPLKTDFVFVGNPNPKFQMGWNNSIDFKNFHLNFLVDGKFGGKVMSITQSYMDFMGVSAESGEARDNGGLTINGVNDAKSPVTTVDPKVWYTRVGARAGFSGAYMYDATVVRLREVALGYTVPLKGKTVKSLQLSLTGRNLFYFYKKAPYDPEVTMSTGNGLAGIDVFNQPATRDIGINLNIHF